MTVQKKMLFICGRLIQGTGPEIKNDLSFLNVETKNMMMPFQNSRNWLNKIKYCREGHGLSEISSKWKLYFEITYLRCYLNDFLHINHSSRFLFLMK